ncbi:MarR family winged helix-turn-helix transcriptional regulator [Actinopolyspora lacussalsi]
MTEDIPDGAGEVASESWGSAGTEREQAAAEVERELAMMFRRARKMSLEVAAEVHPELDPASYSLLLMVADAGSMRAIEMAERIGLDKSTVSRQIANLERLDLLRRAPDPQDGRARLIQLSESGRQRLDGARQRRSRHLREDFVQWSNDDLHQFARLLGKLNAMY